MKVLAACGAGIGSSQIIKMKLVKVFKKLDIPCDIAHMSIGMAKSEVNNYEVVFTLAALADSFENVNEDTKIIGLKNVMSEQEMEDKLKEALNIE